MKTKFYGVRGSKKTKIDTVENVTILVISGTRVLHNATYRTCNINMTRTVLPRYKVGSFEPYKMEVEPGSEVTSITASNQVKTIALKR